jgi:hypothetical protein
MATMSGGCLCGAVRYESSAESMGGGHCYCLDCRRSSGSDHCTHLVVPKAAVTLTGEVTTYERPADSGNLVSRAFCPRCGAPVYSTNSGATDFIFLRVSSLDDPDQFRPQMIVYASRAPSWARMDDTLTTFPGMAPPDARPIEME